MPRKTTVASIIATLALACAGYAAAHGRPAGSRGKPSTTPPSWSNGSLGLALGRAAHQH